NKNIKYSQNFLTSEKVLNQIIKQLNLKETDTVYEIGTGKGHLILFKKQKLTYNRFMKLTIEQTKELKTYLKDKTYSPFHRRL
ncbi:rRNA adenine N-6-methyltransferase family protein, partial [Streptococcus suis]